MARKTTEVVYNTMLLVNLMSKRAYSVQNIANTLDITLRHAYRYKDMVEEIGFKIERVGDGYKIIGWPAEFVQTIKQV